MIAENGKGAQEQALVKVKDGREGNFELLVVFELGDQHYGLLASSVREIIRQRETTRVPNASKYIIGVINLRGQIIPVFNTLRRLGLAEHEGQDTIMIVEADNEDAGLRVDKVVDVVKINTASIDQTARQVELSSGHDFIDGTVALDNRLITVLQLASLLDCI